MLHVILLILKIIGIILLVIIGLLLLILLTVLLVPIRYQVAASHGEELRIEGRVSWLLHFIHAGFSHIEGVLHIRVRVFGIILYDNLKPKSPKIKKHKNTVKRKVEHPSKAKVAKTNKRNEDIIKDLKSDTIRIVESHNQKSSIDGSIEDANNDELPETLRRYALYESDEQQEVREEKTSEQSEDRKQPIDKAITERAHQDTKEERKSFLQKILLKLISLKEKITAFFLGLKNKIIRIFETAVNIKQKAGLILHFIKDELNREGFHITYHSLKKLLKHILPTKLRSRIVFGTGDPCTTGQALGIMSILYSFYGDKIQITPDFENIRFEGKHDAKGRIRLVTILIIVIKLMFDKRFKQLKRNFLILKEAL